MNKVMAKSKDKVKVSILLPVETYQYLVNHADKESRSVSAQGGLIIQKFYETNLDCQDVKR
jgi:hypothetical protein